jgi:hypothetical protein
MDASDDARRKRALERAQWPVRKYALGQEPEDDLSALTCGERVAMVWQLTLDAWATMGAEIPDYSRSEMPGKVVRRRGQTT